MNRALPTGNWLNVLPRTKPTLTNLMNNLERRDMSAGRGYERPTQQTVVPHSLGELKVRFAPILNLVYANAEEILSTERTARYYLN